MPKQRMTEEQIVDFIKRTSVLCAAITDLEEVLKEQGHELPNDIAEVAAELEALADDELVARGIGRDLPPGNVHELN